MGVTVRCRGMVVTTNLLCASASGAAEFCATSLRVFTDAFKLHNFSIPPLLLSVSLSFILFLKS